MLYSALALGQVVLGTSHATRSKTTPAPFVSRLHRWDHSGAAAMIEREASWLSGKSAYEDAPRRFVSLSDAQADALADHHDSMVQLSMTVERAQGPFADLIDKGIHAVREAAIHAGEAAGDASDHIGRAVQVAAHHAKEAASTANEQFQQLQHALRGAAAQAEPLQLRDIQRHAPETVPHNKFIKALHLDDLHCQYVGPVIPGTKHGVPMKPINVVWDTGSTNLWVNSDLCLDGACSIKSRSQYNHTDSETYEEPEDPFSMSIRFGTGGISGRQGTDDIHVGPFTIHDQVFGMVASMEGNVFAELPLEGILGLGFPSMSANGVVPFFDNMILQHTLDKHDLKNQFAFYFSDADASGNAVFFGGYDDTFLDGPMHYFPVTQQHYWTLDAQSFKIGEEEYFGSKTVDKNTRGDQQYSPKYIVDSGTTYFTADGDLFPRIMDRLRTMDCDKITKETHPDLTFTIKSVKGELLDHVVAHRDYMVAHSGDLCRPAFMRIDVPAEFGPAMILGEVFMRKYMTVFDRGHVAPGATEVDSDAMVGFGQAKHDSAVQDHLRGLTSDQPAFGQAVAAAA